MGFYKKQVFGVFLNKKVLFVHEETRLIYKTTIKLKNFIEIFNFLLKKTSEDSNEWRGLASSIEFSLDFSLRAEPNFKAYLVGSILVATLFENLSVPLKFSKSSFPYF